MRSSAICVTKVEETLKAPLSGVKRKGSIVLEQLRE